MIKKDLIVAVAEAAEMTQKDAELRPFSIFDFRKLSGEDGHSIFVR